MVREFAAEDTDAGGPSDDVAEGDAAKTPADARDPCRWTVEQAAKDEGARETQEELVGNRKAEDAEELREEQDEWAVLDQPRCEMALHGPRGSTVDGVGDGVRTRDFRSHSPALYR